MSAKLTSLTIYLLLVAVNSAAAQPRASIERFSVPAAQWERSTLPRVGPDSIEAYSTRILKTVARSSGGRASVAPFSGTDRLDWVRYFGSSNGTGASYGKDIVSDTLGNLYVVSGSTSQPFGSDIVLTKYDSGGAVLWQAQFDSEFEAYDAPCCVVLDGSESVYVTGRSRGADGTTGIVTLRYSQDGELVWSTRFPGIPNSNDQPTALAIDSSGNVYIGGQGAGSVVATGPASGLLDYDFLVIKYSANGSELWHAYWDGADVVQDGLGATGDELVSIAVDQAGFLTVAGTAWHEGNRRGYATLRYDASGNLVWVARYTDGLVHNTAVAMALDQRGNVIVTGTGRIEGAPANTYTTIKYDASGALAWIVQHSEPLPYRNEPQDLAVDSEGNVYLTGWSNLFQQTNTGSDILSVKYAPDGRELWSSRFVGDVGQDVPIAVQLDDAGDVYVVGTSETAVGGVDYVVLKYDSDGNELWRRVTDLNAGSDDYPSAMVAPHTGGIGVSGSSRDITSQSAILRYDRDGQLVWKAEVEPPPTSYDLIRGLASGAGGSTYAISMSWNDATAWDCLLTKHNPDGAIEWTVRYDRGRALSDEPTAVYVDARENVYIAGQTWNGTDWDAFVVVYDESGNLLWDNSFGESGDDGARAISVDSGGTVYVTGFSTGATSALDYFVAKYNADGDEVWSVRYDGPAGGDDIPVAVAVDELGFVYVSGSSFGTNTGEDYATLKLDQDGNELWVARYTGPLQERETVDDYKVDRVVALRLDDAGKPIISGWSYNPESRVDLVTIKYDTAGGVQWLRSYSEADAENYAAALDVDAAGGIYVTGTTGVSGFSLLTLKYGSDGEELWNSRYDHPAEGSAQILPSAIAVDGTGRASVLAFSFSLSRPAELLLLQYDSDGRIVFADHRITRGDRAHPSPHLMRASPFREAYISLDAQNNVFAAASVRGVDGWIAYLLARYSAAEGSASDPNPRRPARHELHASAPNPFADRTAISYTLRSEARVALRIYDILGRHISTLVDTEQTAGWHAVEWDGHDQSGGLAASGIYFAHLSAGGETHTVRIVLMR